MLDSLIGKVDIFNVNDSEVYFVCLVLKGVRQSDTLSFNVHVLENQLLEALLVLDHELGDEVQLVELHVDEGNLSHIVLGVVVVANVLVLEASFGGFWEVRQYVLFYLYILDALGFNHLNMAVVNLFISMECYVLNAGVSLGVF